MCKLCENPMTAMRLILNGKTPDEALKVIGQAQDLADLMSAWAACWITEDEGRVAELQAWLESKPDLWAGLPPMDNGVVAGGLDWHVRQVIASAL